MATLTDTKVKDTYQTLLKVTTGSIGGGFSVVQDGAANDSGLSLSTSGIGATKLTFITTPTTGTTETSALFLNASDEVVTKVLSASAFTLPNIIAGSSVSVSGAYPNITVTNTAPDQTVSMTAGTGVSVSGTYPSFTVANTAPDQTVAIAGTGNIAVTGTYPNFTVDGTALISNGVHEEMFIGVIETPYPLSPAVNEVIAWTAPNNLLETKSYHFGQTPAQLRLISGGLGIENVSGSSLTVYVDISSAVTVNNPNSNITYTMQRLAGGVWGDIKSVTRHKSSVGLQTDSFWGVFILQAPEKLRVVISSTTGNVIFENSSQVKFEVKELGNII